MILKYIEGVIRDDSLVRKTADDSSSQVKSNEPTIMAVSGESKRDEKTDDERPMDRSKFKKVEMPVFNGTDPYSWLFRVD